MLEQKDALIQQKHSARSILVGPLDGLDLLVGFGNGIHGNGLLVDPLLEPVRSAEDFVRRQLHEPLLVA